MGTVLGTALVLVALAALIYPFLRRRTYAPPADSAPERLRAERQRIYRQITDLEADRTAGDVTEEDYRAQLGELRTAAARAMRDEASIGTGGGEEQLEREIEAARKARHGPPEGGDGV